MRQSEEILNADPPVARILMVDDHPPNLIALEAILQPLGQDLVKVTSGEDALREPLEGDFALILMDVQMPGIDGLQTEKLIQERPRRGSRRCARLGARPSAAAGRSSGSSACRGTTANRAGSSCGWCRSATRTAASAAGSAPPPTSTSKGSSWPRRRKRDRRPR